MSRKSKIVLVSALVPSLFAIAAALWFFLIVPHQAAAASPASSVEIVEVERITKSEGIEISGNIEPVNSADLAFPIAGYIDAVYVSEGDIVDAGEVVAVLEDSQYLYDLAEVDVEIDTENVTGTKRNLDLLELKRVMTVSALDDTRLTTTISGIVTSIDAEAGDYVTAQAAGSEDDVVVRIIDRSSMKATVEVDELDAPYLAEGQKVEFQFDAYPDLEIFGEVSFVPLEARETTQGIAVLDAEVTIYDPPAEILPYFTFAGEIFLDDSEEILLIPSDAVTTRGNRTMVMLAMSPEEAEAARAERTESGAQERTPPEGAAGGPAGMTAIPDLPEGYTVIPTQVTVSEYSSGKVQVLSGLEAGDQVVVITATGTAADAASEEEEGGTNVMDLLGMSSRPGGGGPPPGGN